MTPPLPLGKLPPSLLVKVLSTLSSRDPRIRLGPGIGLDCAVIQMGPTCLVAKTDPITFATEAIGWYAVHICSNDIATTGAAPRWFLASLLLPENETTDRLVEDIFEQIRAACESVGASLVGGHTEITHDLHRPIVVGTMLGEIAAERLITPNGASVGDVLLLTKGIPIEGAAILAREKGAQLAGRVEPGLIERARGFLHSPGISVVREALIAAETGGVTAMHDPTEGGLASGLWELAEACGHGIEVDLAAIPILPEAAALCAALGLDPLATIASGALLIAAKPEIAGDIQSALSQGGILSAAIGRMVEGPGVRSSLHGRDSLLPRPERDEITKVFEDSQ